MKWKRRGVVSIPGSLCPCNGMEFWFYLIGGSHPLFRMQAQTDRRSSIIPGELDKLCCCSLFHTFFPPLPSLLSSWLFPISPAACSVILLNKHVFGRPGQASAVGIQHTTLSLRGAKRKRVMESGRSEKLPQMNILYGSSSGSPSFVNFLSGCSIIHVRTPNVWCLHAAAESAEGPVEHADRPPRPPQSLARMHPP